MASRMDFSKYFTMELESLVGQKLSKKDGMSLVKIRAAEKRLGHSMPESLKVYYRVAGNLRLNTEHNVLLKPEELRIEKGMLFFMEENQLVVFWSFKMKDLSKNDPEVYQGVNSKTIEWYSENMNFSEFIVKMWKWQREQIHQSGNLNDGYDFIREN